MSEEEILSLENKLRLSEDPLARHALKYINKLKESLKSNNDFSGEFYEKMITREVISSATEATFNLTLDQLKKKTRRKIISRPRQITQYVLLKRFKFGPSALGCLFDQNHTSSLHAKYTISDQVGLYSDVSERVEKLTAEIIKQCESKQYADQETFY